MYHVLIILLNPLGSCQYDVDNHDNNWNGGNSNSKLYYEEGLIWSNYTGGTKCHAGKYERNTIINFVCAKEGTGNGYPVFVDETDNCTYYFSWHTELACEKKVLYSLVISKNPTDTK